MTTKVKKKDKKDRLHGVVHGIYFLGSGIS